MKIRLLGLALSIGLLSLAAARPQSTDSKGLTQKPLDASVYDSWKSIRGTSLSRDGAWLCTQIAPQEGDTNVLIKNLNDVRTINVPRGAGMRFSKDSQFAVGLVVPPFADVRAARRKKVKPEDMPKNKLAIVDLKSGQISQIENVASYSLPDEDSGWVAYRLEPPKEDSPAKTPEAGKPAASKPKEKKPGQPLVIRNFVSGKEETIPFVSQLAFAKDGTALVYATATKDGKGDGVVLDDLGRNFKTNLSTAPGEYPQLAVSSNGGLAGFEYKPEPKPSGAKDKEEPGPPVATELYLFKAGLKKPERVGLDSLPKGWAFNENTALRFSEKGTRLIYATYPAPPAPAKEVPDDEKVSLDVWTWQDTKLMPAQLLDAETERKRGYLAVVETSSTKSMQVADREFPTVQISDKSDGRFAVGSTTVPYDREASWDPGFQDYNLIDLKENRRFPVAHHEAGSVEMSPTGAYVTFFDEKSKSWNVLSTESRRETSLTSGIKTSLADELNDTPSAAESYGIVGWLSESRPVVADRFDLWVCDATGKSGPVRLTRGRELSMRFRPIPLDPDQIYLPTEGLLLDAFNEDSKQSGVYAFRDGFAQRLLMADKLFGGFVKAKNADRLVYTRQDFTEFPDLWSSDLSLNHPVKLTDANPQQKEYLWGKAELVHWTSLDGVPLSGILVKPANFDYGKQYPMIAYFYERLSDSLNAYHPPAPSASTVNESYLASNGYCVFIPDIPYRVGFPGYSALSAIVPGVQSIVSRGYVDPKRLGIQGQSWGGYQVAYLVTQTNMFAAAEAGAPVGDMFSAYGGIRYGSGVVREMQYEHGQSRIGGTPWDSTLRYIENSPVFFADKVQTPLMIMSNDKDGAVPHTQGIELFTALRRLDKPCWMVVYNGEDHNIMERKNRKDFGIRLYQYFDHFLKGAPMPEWMAKGIPAVDKGRTMGLDPVP